MDGRGPASKIGEALVMVVSPEHSTVRIESARDSIEVGDRVAVHR
jgi:hypothetical protein